MINVEELDIITLDNNKDYVIAKMLKHNEKDYLLLIEVDKDENLLEEKLIVERVNDSTIQYLKRIDDDLTNEIVSEKFAKLLLNDIK